MFSRSKPRLEHLQAMPTMQYECTGCRSCSQSMPVKHALLRACCDLQVQAKRFLARTFRSTQLYFRVKISRHDPTSRLVQYRLGEFQLGVIVLDFPSTLPRGIAGSKPMLLWVPVHVLIMHGSMMSGDESRVHQGKPLSRLPTNTSPCVWVRLGLPDAIATGAPIGQPLFPAVKDRHTATFPKPPLRYADLM